MICFVLLPFSLVLSPEEHNDTHSKCARQHSDREKNEKCSLRKNCFLALSRQLDNSASEYGIFNPFRIMHFHCHSERQARTHGVKEREREEQIHPGKYHRGRCDSDGISHSIPRAWLLVSPSSSYTYRYGPSRGISVIVVDKLDYRLHITKPDFFALCTEK